jgi:high affinity Mn2+ porin
MRSLIHLAMRLNFTKTVPICIFLVLCCSLPALAQTPSVEAPPQPSSEKSEETPDPKPQSIFPHFKEGPIWISGQSNFIFQTHPDFPAKYSGKNSLRSSYEKATSRVLTLFTGVKITNSLEALADVEESGGAGLSTSLGVAGFPNLDVVRNPQISKSPYLARVLVHKVFSFSRDTNESDRGPLSGFNHLPTRRLEIRAGKFSMVDFFDQNSVGSDSHLQFTNWSVDNNGAYDYAADTRGYIWGAVVDYEVRTWGLRFAETLMPKVANGIDYVWNLRQANAENVEFEYRHGIFPRRSGIIRFLGFSNHANMGVYREAVALYEHGAIAAPDITAHPRRTTAKYGFGINLEQSLMTDLIAFARWGWNNGRTESYVYTEIDSTFVEGLGIYGRRWQRSKDRAGVAFASNSISRDHQAYLSHGGYGFIIGDGTLTYGRENIFETYYTAHLWRGIYASPGFQHVVNPGFNQDRGPVNIPTFRLHLEY